MSGSHRTRAGGPDDLAVVPFVPVHHRVAAHARRDGAHPALVCGGERLSYGALDARADALAQA
ncbi:MAG: hypothetical protein ABW179_06190, partial [Methylobacterium sp.]